MSRSRARLVWGLLGGLLLIGMITAVEFARGFSQSIDQQNAQLESSKQELENAARLSTQLAKLDDLTINENTATRLEILRHLGLEQNDYDIAIGSKVMRPVGSVTLSQRQVRVTANLAYRDALALADKLYNNGKMNLTGAMLGIATQPHAEVEVIIDGTLYGLDKRGQQ